MSAQVGCDGAALVADFFVAGAAGFLADIFAIYDWEICLEDVLKENRRMEKEVEAGSSGGWSWTWVGKGVW